MRIIEWKITNSLVPYQSSVEAMEQRVAAIRTGAARELVWLLEHPAIYTRGSSANEDELLRTPRFPVFDTGRGGRYTYHGPGQRVIYVMLDLTRHGSDVRSYVNKLEQWLIDTLANKLMDRADVFLPAATWAEKSGTFENCNNVLQLFEQAIQPIGLGWWITDTAYAAMGEEGYIGDLGTSISKLKDKV